MFSLICELRASSPKAYAKFIQNPQSDIINITFPIFDEARMRMRDIADEIGLGEREEAKIEEELLEDNLYPKTKHNKNL
mgnify:CR=1 FL=1